MTTKINDKSAFTSGPSGTAAGLSVMFGFAPGSHDLRAYAWPIGGPIAPRMCHWWVYSPTNGTYAVGMVRAAVGMTWRWIEGLVESEG